MLMHWISDDDGDRDDDSNVDDDNNVAFNYLINLNINKTNETNLVSVKTTKEPIFLSFSLIFLLSHFEMPYSIGNIRELLFSSMLFSTATQSSIQIIYRLLYIECAWLPYCRQWLIKIKINTFTLIDFND